MPGDYIGHLPVQDPLYGYLRHEILPQLGRRRAAVDFRVFRLKDGRVYLYEEKHSHARILGKFFFRKGGDGPKAGERMRREFSNLELLRNYGFVGHPHRVIRPLGANIWLNSVLVEEYAEGAPLSALIYGAMHLGRKRQLFAKLTALAYFLATLHNRTANGWGVDFSEDCAYLDRLVRKLRSQRIAGDWEAEELFWLRDRWREQPRMWEDRQVLVHGDATPSNFLFGPGLSVIAIDLERMRRADRAFDLGRIAGELQHFYLQAGDKSGAEPFIGHFLWEYACHFPDRDRAFHSITRRVPFQMALTLLRIARNSWVAPSHKRRLIEEAKCTLRAF